MAMAGMVFDAVEQILVRLEVEDLIRCKRVCKSWYSLISSQPFVKLQLSYACNNDENKGEGGHRRIVRPTYLSEDHFYYFSACAILGSSNGLVCLKGPQLQLLVTNPSTAETKLVLPMPEPDESVYEVYEYCWGFGYDSHSDDYKVIAAVGEDIGNPQERDDIPTTFHVLNLIANASWRLLAQINYGYSHRYGARSGVLCDGALHWFMISYANNGAKVILSLDLATEEFKEIPQPEYEYECHDDHRLGVIQGCLCIYNHRPEKNSDHNKWLYYKRQSWELIPENINKYNLVHYLRMPVPVDHTPGDNGRHGICLSTTWDYVCAPIFVQSLVSPHANNAKNNTTFFTYYPRLRLGDKDATSEKGPNSKKKKRKKHKRKVRGAR